MSPVVCGLDVHKDSTYATILNPEGKIINQTRMDNEKAQSYLLHFKVGKVAMEASTRASTESKKWNYDHFRDKPVRYS
jgi:hypothetical protein